MILKLYDSSMNLTGICDGYISLEYTKTLNSSGGITLMLAPGSSVPAVQSYICAETDGGIYYVTGSARDKKTGIVTVTGENVLSLLKTRIIDSDRMFASYSPQGIICTLAYVFGRDAYPISFAYNAVTTAGSVSYVTQYGEVFAAVKKLAAAYGIGMRVRYLADYNAFEFIASPLRDRTRATGEDPVVLSDALENIFNASYECDLTSYANCARVFGAETGLSSPKYYNVTVMASDCTFGDAFDDSAYAVREVILNQHSLSTAPFTQTYGDIVQFNETEYINALRTRGIQALAGRRPKKHFTAQIPDAIAKRLQCGDKCTLVFSPSHLSCDAVVTSMTVRDDNTTKSHIIRLSL